MSWPPPEPVWEPQRELLSHGHYDRSPSEHHTSGTAVLSVAICTACKLAARCALHSQASASLPGWCVFVRAHVSAHSCMVFCKNEDDYTCAPRSAALREHLQLLLADWMPHVHPYGSLEVESCADTTACCLQNSSVAGLRTHEGDQGRVKTSQKGLTRRTEDRSVR